MCVSLFHTHYKTLYVSFFVSQIDIQHHNIKQNMPYARGQQAKIWIDQNNPNAWRINPIQNWQWTPAVVTYYDAMHFHVTCIVASPPYLQYPVFTSVWQTMQTFDSANVRPLGGDAAAGFGI